MLKKTVFDHPNKMHFESAHKTFNQQTVLIAPDNLIAPTQYSNHIRPYTETPVQWNGEPTLPGHLQDFDLSYFRDMGIPRWIFKEVCDLTHTQGGILYLFKHFSKEERILDGLVLTTREYHHVKTWYLNQNWKAQDAVDEATRYIVHEEDQHLRAKEDRHETNGEAPANGITAS